MKRFAPTAGRTARNPDWWIPWSFVAFFGVLVVVNAIMVFFAVKTWTGLDTDDAFRQGLAYNERLAQTNAQIDQGWQVQLDFSQAEAGAGQLEVALKDRYGTPLTHALVTAHVARPTDRAADFELVFEDLGNGLYRADLAPPLSGQWDVRLTAEHERGEHRLLRRVFVR